MSPPSHLWESDHPYYATQGCYYVGYILGHESRVNGFDGNSCHDNYATWQDFKDANPQPYTAEQLAERRRFGIDDAERDEKRLRYAEQFGKSTVHSMDMDLNLLYRWDWTAGQGEDENSVAVGKHQLELFFMAQRKARPFSVTIVDVTPDEEPEIRAWLWTRWIHMMRLWAPVSGWPVEAHNTERDSDGNVHFNHEALEHVACAIAEAAIEATP